MAKRICIFIIVLSAALVNGGGCNVYNDISNKKSDASILDDIRHLIDRGYWDDAIQKFSLLSPAAFQQASTVQLKASAYAGRGGLSLISLISALAANTSSGSKTLFQLLMSAFPSANYTRYHDILTAQTLMLQLAPSTPSTLTQLTLDEGIFLIFVEFAKLGTLFTAIADLDNDGTLDLAFDNCNKANLSDGDAAEVGAAIGIILTVLTNTGSSIGLTSVSGLQTLCASFPAGSCAITNPNDNAFQSNPLVLQALRTLVGETNSGIGLKVVANASTFEFAAPMNVPPANLCP
jgi:hypothetical protein